MAKRLDSNLVSVFPSVKRSDVQLSARYQSENTFAELLRRICDYNDPLEPLVSKNNNGTFIITKRELDTVSGKLTFIRTKPFEFCIYGYYFYIKQLSYITDMFNDSTVSDIYAFIDLDEYTLGEYDIKPQTELNGRDETEQNTNTTVYTGLKFDTTANTTVENRHYIHLFHRDVTGTSIPNWENSVYINSICKVDNNSILSRIDCGVII